MAAQLKVMLYRAQFNGVDVAFFEHYPCEVKGQRIVRPCIAEGKNAVGFKQEIQHSVIGLVMARFAQKKGFWKAVYTATLACNNLVIDAKGKLKRLKAAESLQQLFGGDDFFLNDIALIHAEGGKCGV